MADLRTCSASMAELVAHLVEHEGAIDHLYCDHRGLVTVAVGALVDRAGASDHARLALARKFCRKPNVQFHRRGRQPASPPASLSEVLADWRRVRDFGRAHPNHRARSYSSVAQLRLAQSSIESITKEKIATYAATLYARRPSLLRLDPHVAMALVDCRYNPAGVRLYGSQMDGLWSCLSEEHYDPSRAIELFEALWRGRGGAAYQRRHQQRLAWMRQGLGTVADSA